MNPQSSRSLGPMVKDGINQISHVSGVPAGSATLKIRWKASYRIRGEIVEESGGNDNVNVS